MARSIPPERFPQLIDVATKTFIARGYRLTQMADVADALGVAKGTVYGYVESKEALFDAALRFADGQADPPAPAELPLRTPARGATVRYVRERLTKVAADLVLIKIMSGAVVIDDAGRELEAVLGDLYERLAKNRLALKLVDRCAADYPELAKVWFGEGRWAQHQLLVELLRRRAKRGQLRALHNPEIVARTMLETIAFWAMHRHFDASPQQVDDDEARRAVIDLLSRGLLATPRRTARSKS